MIDNYEVFNVRNDVVSLLQAESPVPHTRPARAG